LPVTTIKKKTLGKQIKKQREKEKLSQRQAALKCDITPASFHDIEKGIIFPSEKTFLNLIEKLNFDNKPKICDIYAKLKETIPPDVVKYLYENPSVVDDIRQRMKIQEEKR